MKLRAPQPPHHHNAVIHNHSTGLALRALTHSLNLAVRLLWAANAHPDPGFRLNHDLLPAYLLMKIE